MDRRSITELFSKVKERNPLVHQITNNVTINDCANVTLAIGASPVMAASPEEVADMVNLAESLVINFGTIDEEMFTAMIRAGRAANERGIPVVFDPVGVGATRYRTEKASELVQQVDMAVICGNASEVYALIGGRAVTRGVDASKVDVSSVELATTASRQLNCVTVISGKQDVISNGVTAAQIANGDIWLTRVTGTGCMATALIGCFAGVTDDYFAAAIAGMSVMSVSGELARKQLQEKAGIGTFKMKLMDHIFQMDARLWGEEVRVVES